jgi:phage recombination protein Bet
MSTALSIASEAGYSPAKLQLIKDTIARGATDDELALFLYTAQRTGLDPLTRQIYCIKRWDSTLQRDAMTTQTSIDGLRLVADRTGRYAPGRATTYEYDKNGDLVSATAYILKYVQGTWHEASATAYYVEYIQTKRDGTPTAMWKSKPRIMLGKCAEALVLRRGFPAELSGVYASEEMGDEEQRPAPAAPVIVEPAAKPAPRMTAEEVKGAWARQNDRADALGMADWQHDIPTGQKLAWYIDEVERRAALIAQAETVIDAA